MSQIGVVGAGTAGLAAAALLARAGHASRCSSARPIPGPVGAGLLLQPTGIAVLERLGVLDEVRAGAARIDRVVGTTVAGKRFMDLAYARLGPGVHGLGVHRGALFSALRGAAERAGAAMLPGVEVVRRQDRTLFDAGGARYGPYDRIVGADGARSTMRRFLGVPRPHPRAPLGRAVGRASTTRRTRSRARSTSTSTARGGWPGSCPTGSSAVSLFWSVRLDRIEAVRAAGIDAFRADLLSLAPVGEPLLGGLTSMDQLLPASYRQVSLRALARRDARAARRRRARASARSSGRARTSR